MAQGAVGAAYVKGLGVSRNCTEGLKCTRLSADAGYPKSQVGLGLMYKDGLYADKDPDKAVALFRKAAKAQEPSAYANLGMASINGMGVPQDGLKGLHLLLRAASEGYRPAMVVGARVAPYVIANLMLSGKIKGDKNQGG